VCSKYNIHSGINEDADVWFICVPPRLHGGYYNPGKHTFIETPTTHHFPLISKRKIIAPSCSFLFHPAYKIIKKILLSGELGKIYNVIYHSGKALDVWRKEGAPSYVDAYYLANFELLWLTHLFGFPEHNPDMERMGGVINMGVMFPEHMGSFTFDVISNKPVRRMVITGENTTLTWNADSTCVSVYSPKYKRPTIFPYDGDIEKVYLEETKAFVEAIEGERTFPNTVEHTEKAMKIMEDVRYDRDSCQCKNEER
jgi:predicted dehydrogenase